MRTGGHEQSGEELSGERMIQRSGRVTRGSREGPWRRLPKAIVNSLGWDQLRS